MAKCLKLTYFHLDVYKSTWQVLQAAAAYNRKHVPYLSTEQQLLDKIIYKQSQAMRREKLLCNLKQVRILLDVTVKSINWRLLIGKGNWFQEIIAFYCR